MEEKQDRANPPREQELPSRERKPTPPDQNSDQYRAAHGPSEKRAKPWHHRPLAMGLLMLAVIAGVVIGVLAWRHFRSREYTDDAYIDIVSGRVSPQVPGRVLRVAVNDNQDVSAGQLLVEIDPADYEARLDQARAGLAQAQAQRAQAEAQRSVFEAQVEQARAGQIVAEANSANAEAERRRFEDLRAANAGAVSREQFDNAEAAARSSQAQLQAAQKSVAAAEAQLGYAASQLEAAQAQIRSATAQIQQAQLALSYTQVTAKLNGRIASKTVAEGNYVQPGTELMAIVPHEVYVTANFKETQLARMRRGQPAEITVDSYPDLKLHGHVDSIQPATGQIFSVLPAQNATGNWVKIVQRVPVKIVLDSVPDNPDRRLSPGMSVEATVTVR